MCEEIEEVDQKKLAIYCKNHFRQKNLFPKSFIDASYEDLVKFLKSQERTVEDVFLEIFLEETPDPLQSK
ncbi:MAG: hypothetical protein ACFFD2_03380 [Promethearchaeota archaeon]